jgi:outer membrane protein TolC
MVCAEEKTQPLLLNEVVHAAEQAFPALLAAEQRRQASEGEYIAAQGGFDTQLKAQSSWSIIGLYENQNYDVSVEQPTPFLGTTFFGGWRRGNGEYPVYEGKALTATDGELRVGMNLPLLRNRDIDRRRATLKQAELAKLIAGHDVEQALLEVRRQASYRYWDWLMAGQRLKITEELLQVAEARNQGILDRVALGDIPQFEALDNQRAIIERRERKVAAQRLLEQSAIQLSLYWRDAKGDPVMPKSSQLPDGFPDQEPQDVLDFERAWQTAQARRPELNRLELQQQQTETELALQKNQQQPGLDFRVQGAFDVGKTKKSDLNRDELYLGLNIDIPLQQRVAKGREQAAAANLRRLKWDRQMAENQISAEIKDALSKLDAARKRLILSKQQHQAALELQTGEQERFDLGASNILFVNMREIASGDAALSAIEAANTVFKAYADIQVALGVPEKSGATDNSNQSAR